MKKSMQLFCVIFLWLGALLPVLYGGSISSCENILFTDGKAMLEKTTKCVYNASFSKGSPIGKPTMNYRNKTAFTLQMFKGRESLVITPADGKKSSAWGVRVAPFAVEGGREFLLEMDVCGSVSMLKGSGRINYSNYYFFLDKENRICRDDGFFYYETLSDQWITSKVSGRIPADAVKMVLQIGGAPTLQKGGFLAYSRICVRQFDNSTPSKKSGFFISRPIPLEKDARLTCKVHPAPGSTLAFQVQTAPDVKGRPGTWSAWKDLSNAPFDPAAGWLRYKALFRGNGKSAVLQWVKVGDFIDKDYSAAKDDHGPIAVRISTSPVQDPMAPVVFRMDDATGVNYATLRCFLNKKEITSRLKRKGNILTYIPEKPLHNPAGKVKNLHCFTFRMEDLAGNKAEMNEFCFVGPAPTGNKVTTRKDGMLLINGKAFFPLGFFSGKPDKDQMPILKAHGVNFLQSFDGTQIAPALVKLAEQYDIKLCIRYWLTQHSNSKAVIGYYTADDSRRFSDYVLRGTYNQVRAIAPNILRGHSEMPFQSYSSYYAPKIWTSDFFMAQLYPISNKRTIIRCGAQRIITDMKTMVRDRKNSVNPSHCILAGPQAYADKKIWTRYPTKEETKLMAYLSVIHGANGVVYYSYTSARKSPGEYVYKAALETLKELSVLSPVLLTGETVFLPHPVVEKGPALDPDKNESINILARILGKDLYILAANSAGKPITVRFRGMKGTKAILPFEKRSVNISNGIMKDTFGGHAVHVYKITLP